MDKRRDSIVNTLDAVKEDQIREFLAEEMESNEELWERFVAVFGVRRGNGTDYLTMVESMYSESVDGRYGLVPYGIEIDFGKITRLARAHEGRKDYEEAIRVYRELSEVIAKNMDMIDDSDGYYGICFSDSIHSMVECINRQGVIKERHIKYMFEKFMLKEPDYFAEHYEYALSAICTTANDLACWEKLLDPHIPDTIPSYDKNWTSHYNALRLIRMKIAILERTGSQALIDILAKHYRDDQKICNAYIVHLKKKKDRQAAIRIAEEGARLFSHS